MTGTIRRRGPTNMSTLLATVKGEVVNLQHQQLGELESINRVILSAVAVLPPSAAEEMRRQACTRGARVGVERRLGGSGAEHCVG